MGNTRQARQRVVAHEALLLAGILLGSPTARAQSVPPAPRPDQQFDFMNLLAHHGLHDINHESWNAYGQFTFMSSWKLRFPAAYTNANGSINSLLPDPEWSFTGTLTLYLGMRLWKGAEFYVAPELISERPFSQLRGLGGAIQNFELQKGGTDAPQLYHSRLFLRQTFGLGGGRVVKESDPLQLGTVYDRRRIVLNIGNFSILDFFDRSAVLGDLRQTFFSLGFLTYAAWDFNSDARGYSWGAVAELYWDDWAVRFGRITPPKEPNQLPVDFRFYRYYGDQAELEHKHRIFGREGAVRVLGYRNRNHIGRFDDAVKAFQANPLKNATTCPGFNYGSKNENAPDLCWARKTNVKLGIGLSLEQFITQDIGVFFRGMISDGDTEVDAYTSTDRSVSFGAVGKGSLWHRPADVTGVGVNLGWISQAHAEYLRLGGIDGFIGDGNIHPAMEGSLDLFYSVNFLSSVWISGDYQYVINPGFNADRGPVHILGVRIHAEF